ncbi:ribonuclease J [Beduini massiliensis]|uniref:ribonuclease J n=1 Tax=Beduini massiliensis TaxID=1585974 RepID=UPI00059A7EF4|nr:ribonuclease J [Beduini massiliensis]
MNDVVKILPLGGQAEMGKNMYVININEKLFIIDAGFRFPESEKLGVDIIIPSFDYLKERKDQIAGIFITHGHDDTMAALPYLLEQITVKVYAPTLTADLIVEMIEQHNRLNRTRITADIVRVRRKSDIDVAGVHIKFFPVTHSIPGSIGIAFETSEGYIVHAGEFIIDFGAPSGFKTDIQTMMEIGSKGVLALLCESSYAQKPGYTSPKHKIKDKIDPIFEDATGRIIVASYAQNIFRTKEIIELTKRYNRKIVFYGRDKYDNTNSIVRMGNQLKKAVIEIPKENIAFKSQIGRPDIDDQLVVLLTGRPTRIYHDISDIIDGGDEMLKINEKDTFIVVSPVVPGTEKIATKAQNELYKTDAKIYIFKNKDLSSMHASIEDLKVMLQIFHPKYYIPIRGEYQHFIANAAVAKESGLPEENVIIMDNGEEITFKDGQLQHAREYYEIEDVMIDGIGVGDVGMKVIDDRIQLSNDGVVIIGMTINDKREIVANTDVQTRGFVYLKDSEHIVKGILKIAEDTMTENQANSDVDVADIRQMIKDKAYKYIMKQTGKKPVILPIVIEI